MPQAHYENDVTILAPVLKAEIEMLKQWMGERFDDIRADIVRIEHQIDGLDVHNRERCTLIEARIAQHEQRIGFQEKQSIWRWGATILSAFLALLGIRLNQ